MEEEFLWCLIEDMAHESISNLGKSRKVEDAILLLLIQLKRRENMVEQSEDDIANKDNEQSNVALIDQLMKKNSDQFEQVLERIDKKKASNYPKK